jgi:YHS domain-containing protein
LVSHAGSARIAKVLLFLIAALAIALSLATLLGRPRPVAAQESAQGPEELQIGLPAYLFSDPSGNQRIMYADSSISINTVCPVRRARVDPNRDPVYVNGRPVAFCCTPCPAVFSQDPERYLREMKVSLRCPVRPARRAIFDSSLRMKVNQDIFFFSNTSAMKTFRKDPIRYCGVLTDPVSRERFRPTRQSPHVTFRGREYYFAADATLARFQAQPERCYERVAGT